MDQLLKIFICSKSLNPPKNLLVNACNTLDEEYKLISDNINGFVYLYPTNDTFIYERFIKSHLSKDGKFLLDDFNKVFRAIWALHPCNYVLINCELKDSSVWYSEKLEGCENLSELISKAKSKLPALGGLGHFKEIQAAALEFSNSVVENNLTEPPLERSKIAMYNLVFEQKVVWNLVDIKKK